MSTKPVMDDILLAIPEDDVSRVVKWEDIVDTEMLDLYFKQRLGPQFRFVPVAAIARTDFISLLNGEDGIDLYTKMCAVDPDASAEAAFTYSPSTSKIVNITFHIESPDPGIQFLNFLKSNGTTDFHKRLVKSLLVVSRACHELHIAWKSGLVPYHYILSKRLAADTA